MIGLHGEEIDLICARWVIAERDQLKGLSNIQSTQLFNLMTFDLRGLTSSDGIRTFHKLLSHDESNDLIGRLQDLYSQVILTYGPFCCWRNYRNFKYAMKVNYEIPGWMIKRLYKKYPYIWLIPKLQSFFLR